MALKAIKNNKEYVVDEVSKATYLKQGYDIYEGGKLIEKSHLSKITKKELDKVVAEKDAKIAELEALLEAANKPTNPYKGKTVEELIAIAAEQGVDIGNATSVDGITKKLLEAAK